MSFDNVMVDLETLDDRETAAIASIGAVRFSLDELRMAAPEFYRLVDTADCQRLGLTIGAATVKWWMGQPDEARAALYKCRVPFANAEIELGPDLLAKALSDFNKFVAEVPGTRVWGNGATFDNMILRNAYRACGLRPAWGFRDDLCYRTVRRLFPAGTPPAGNGSAPGIRHHALDDARRQARQFVRTWRKLKAK
jgi:3'-5' exoribonuclease Rv2179c-like domain